jgi:predicted nucleic acid-binding protein
LLEIYQRLNLVDVVSCGIVKAEVLRGVKSAKLRDRLSDFFSITQMIPTGPNLWDEVWALAWKMDRTGKVIPLTDIIIAACALRADAAVLTYDKHFHSVPGLEVLEP